MYRAWIGLGSLAGLIAVGLSAYAAHAHLDPAQLEIVRSAVQMQGWHAPVLVLCGIWSALSGGRLANLAGAAFALGLAAFCGALYLLAFTGAHAGPMAPLGGTILMIGWALLAGSAFERGRAPRSLDGLRQDDAATQDRLGGNRAVEVLDGLRDRHPRDAR